jgi:hypothetical protein
MSSIDLTGAFLQIAFEISSRPWTAFQFGGQVYQFTRVPFGLRNSLAAFTRALQQIFCEPSAGETRVANAETKDQEEVTDRNVRAECENVSSRKDNIERNSEVRPGGESNCEEFVMCYVDGIIIYSKTFDDHLKH